MNGTLIRAGTMVVDGETLTGVFVEIPRDVLKASYRLPIGGIVAVVSNGDDVHPCNTCGRDWTDCMVGALQCKGYRPRTPVSVPYGEGGRG